MMWFFGRISCYSGSTVLSNKVDGVGGEKNITDMWQRHYVQLVHSNKDTSYKKHVRCWDSIKNIPSRCDVKFDVDDICEAPNSQ